MEVPFPNLDTYASWIINVDRDHQQHSADTKPTRISRVMYSI